MDYVLTQHARDALAKRQILEAWVDMAMQNPVWIEADDVDPLLEHRLAPIAEFGNRLPSDAPATEAGQKRSEPGKGTRPAAPHSTPPREHQPGGADLGHPHNQHPASRRAGRTEPQETDRRNPTVLVVVAAEKVASIQIKDL